MNLQFEVIERKGSPVTSCEYSDEYSIYHTEYQQPYTGAWWQSQQFTAAEELQALSFEILVEEGAQANVQIRGLNDVDPIAAMIINDTGGIYMPFTLEFIGRSTPLVVQFRIWRGQGNVAFTKVKVADPVIEPPIDPPVDPPDDQDGLPIPPPDTTQKHHVTGWKWGSVISLMVMEENQPSTPPAILDDDEAIIPYEIKGWQHGRRLDLQIGNMHLPEEGPEQLPD